MTPKETEANNIYITSPSPLPQSSTQMGGGEGGARSWAISQLALFISPFFKKKCFFLCYSFWKKVKQRGKKQTNLPWFSVNLKWGEIPFWVNFGENVQNQNYFSYWNHPKFPLAWYKNGKEGQGIGRFFLPRTLDGVLFCSFYEELVDGQFGEGEWERVNWQGFFFETRMANLVQGILQKPKWSIWGAIWGGKGTLVYSVIIPVLKGSLENFLRILFGIHIFFSKKIQRILLLVILGAQCNLPWDSPPHPDAAQMHGGNNLPGPPPGSFG